MPAKKKLLPRPCPICGGEYGTLRIETFWDDKSFFRHARYDSNHYSTKVIERDYLNGLGPAHEEKPNRSGGKLWCKGFTSLHLSKGLDTIVIYKGRIMKIRRALSSNRRYVAVRPTEVMLSRIKSRGWQRLSYVRTWNNHTIASKIAEPIGAVL